MGTPNIAFVINKYHKNPQSLNSIEKAVLNGFVRTNPSSARGQGIELIPNATGVGGQAQLLGKAANDGTGGIAGHGYRAPATLLEFADPGNYRNNSDRANHQNQPLNIPDPGNYRNNSDRAQQQSQGNFLGSLADSITKGIGGAVKGVGGAQNSGPGGNFLGDLANSITSGLGSALGSLMGNGQQGPISPQALPSLNLPDSPNISIHRRDFTGQANKDVSSAYKPRYDAINTARNNAKQQYKTSDAVVKAIYQNLANTDTSLNNADKARYDKTAATQANDAGQLQHNIDDTYNQSAAQEAALWKSLGITNKTDPSMLLANVVGDKNAAKTSAAKQSSAQKAANTEQANAQLDHNTAVKGADVTQGGVARQDLTSQLGNVLSGYDANQQDLAGQQANQTLDYGNQLSAQDLTTQTANANQQQSAYQAAVQKAQAEYQAQVANQQFQYQQTNDNRQLQYQQNHDQQALQSQLAQSQMDQYNRDREFQQGVLNSDRNYQLGVSTLEGQQQNNLTQQQMAAKKMQDDLAIAQAQANSKANPQIPFNQQDPLSQVVANARQTYAQNVPPATLNNAITTIGNLYAGSADSQTSFMTKALAALAGLPGLTPVQIQGLVADYWSRMKGQANANSNTNN